MRTVATAAVAGVLAGLPATPAGAAIEPGRAGDSGIAGIELGMNVNEVIAAKGDPDANRVVELAGGQQQRVLAYGKTKALFSSADYDAHPWEIFTTSRSQRTEEGAGVGWTEERLRRAVDRVHCGSPGGFRVCAIGPIRHSQATFYVSKRTRRVTRVSIFH